MSNTISKVIHNGTEFEFESVNWWVTSVNWQTWDVTIPAPDLSNYLAKNNTTAFTPTWDYNPSTKKYVDDKSATVMTEAQYWQVASPITGKIYFIKES